MKRLVPPFLYIDYKKFASLNGYIIGLKVSITSLQNYLVACFNRTIRIESMCNAYIDYKKFENRKGF